MLHPIHISSIDPRLQDGLPLGFVMVHFTTLPEKYRVTLEQDILNQKKQIERNCFILKFFKKKNYSFLITTTFSYR
jgi:hypothetical protein